MMKIPFFRVAVVLLLAANLLFLVRLEQKIPEIPRIYSRGAMEKIMRGNHAEAKSAIDSQAVFQVHGFLEADVNIDAVGGSSVRGSVPVEIE